MKLIHAMKLYIEVNKESETKVTNGIFALINVNKLLKSR